jgi:spermidine synthase
VRVQTNCEPCVDESRIAAVLVTGLAGFTATIGQIVLLRELIILFNGNELSVGIMLATWLLWTAGGSLLTAWLARRREAVCGMIAGAACACGVSLPVTLVAVRMAGPWLRVVPDEVLGIVPMLSISFVCLSVFCGLSGCLFVLGIRLYGKAYAVSGQLSTSYAYLIETSGAALGGILTSILLLRFFGSFQIAMIVASLNIAMALWLFVTAPRLRVVSALAALAMVGVAGVVYVAPLLERATEERLWRGFEVLDSRDTIYGRLTLVDSGGMRSIYDNGSILANVPDPAAAEEGVHYGLLEHANPRRVLLIGGGVKGSITEALKHPSVERLDYVEFDPALIEMFRQHFPAEYATAFSDARVHVHIADARWYLKTSRERYDVILLNAPTPETAQMNRFYTAEFFRIARDHLAGGGILALQLRSSEEHIGPQLAEFLRCIYGTVREVFSNVAVIPGETLHMFAAKQAGAVTENADVLVARLRERNVNTAYVRDYFIRYRMSAERMAQIDDVLRGGAETRRNSDFKPSAYYFSAVLWSMQFKSGYAQLLQRTGRIPIAYALAGLTIALVLLLAIAVLRPPPSRLRIASLWSAGTTGYTLMALQILLLLSFQSIFGYVYNELAMTIGMFMAGLALGTWMGIRHTRKPDYGKVAGRAAVNQLMLAASAPLLLVLMMQMARDFPGNAALAVTQFVFPIFAGVCAVPGGYQFSLSAMGYLQGGEQLTRSGSLYAVDLIGGCAGALFLAGILIPVFGFWNVAWLTMMVNAAPAAILAASVNAHGLGDVPQILRR